VRAPTAVFTAATTVLLLAIWQSHPFVVGRSGPPGPLTLIAPAMRPARQFDVVLPAVPIGAARVRDSDGVLIVHYWAPWQRHARLQAQALDSLRRVPGMERLQVVMVCADPFPSVARFVVRQRLRLRVLIDGRRALREALPCPSMPFTYVIDRAGRIAVRQSGEVDWLAPANRDALLRLMEEAPSPGGPNVKAHRAEPRGPSRRVAEGWWS
jgi:hypothetical protein